MQEWSFVLRVKTQELEGKFFLCKSGKHLFGIIPETETTAKRVVVGEIRRKTLKLTLYPEAVQPYTLVCSTGLLKEMSVGVTVECLPEGNENISLKIRKVKSSQLPRKQIDKQILPALKEKKKLQNLFRKAELM